ncbi:uncharacterized protein IWZ02DRAFT_436416 [Phyllosticta citriasiana]|uniref:uncharacterized protein n=1 Tax=Phyllosticta citriasiana TaxID=595635 RepID=UPI0030FDDA14
MPVRWDADKQATLFVTIMNTHQVAVDAQRVVDSWPEDGKDGDEKPTPRAIKEILAKIKKRVATKSGGTSAATTPVKVSNASRPKSKATPRSAAKKRKRANEDSDSDSPAPSSTRKQVKKLGGGSPTPKRNADASVAPACLLSNSSEDQGVTAPANRNMGYPTPADTASPAETSAYRSTPRRAASVKIANYIKEEQSDSNEDEDQDEEAKNDQAVSDAESDASAWENNAVDEV